MGEVVEEGVQLGRGLGETAVVVGGFNAPVADALAEGSPLEPDTSASRNSPPFRAEKPIARWPEASRQLCRPGCRRCQQGNR
jgi:hypothetical protein